MTEQSRWTFFGSVLPERIPISWQTPIAGKAYSQILDSTFEFRLVMHTSQIIVDINVLDGSPDVFSLRNIAASLAGNLTDLIGYREGCCFSIQIVSAISRDTDDWQVFGIEIPALVKSRQGISQDIDGKVVHEVAQNHAAQIALSDFASAMRYPHGTGFYCFRAIEAIMQSMKGSPNDRDDVGWLALRNNLNVERAAIDQVKSHADLPRHGKPSDMTDRQRVITFEITDEVIRRFLAFNTTGKSPLSPNEFQLLTRLPEDDQ